MASFIDVRCGQWLVEAYPDGGVLFCGQYVDEPFLSPAVVSRKSGFVIRGDDYAVAAGVLDFNGYREISLEECKDLVAEQIAKISINQVVQAIILEETVFDYAFRSYAVKQQRIYFFHVFCLWVLG